MSDRIISPAGGGRGWRHVTLRSPLVLTQQPLQPVHTLLQQPVLIHQQVYRIDDTYRQDHLKEQPQQTYDYLRRTQSIHCILFSGKYE